MEEVIKYFERLEERISTLEAELASLEAELDELKSRPAPEPQVVEKIVEKPVEVIKEVVVEKPVETAAPAEPEIPEVPETPEAPAEPMKEEPAKEEPASPKAAVYGKAVDDIRLAISLGDRFLYQRELFGQNAELMQRTLTEINELQSFDEAMSYINSRFQWDTESNSYQQFVVSLHRRFG
jgi:uncharacterized coiled-coil protein SlyX